MGPRTSWLVLARAPLLTPGSQDLQGHPRSRGPQLYGNSTAHLSVVSSSVASRNLAKLLQYYIWMVLSGHAYDHHSTLNDHWPSFCLLVNLMTIWLQFSACQLIWDHLAMLMSITWTFDVNLAILQCVGEFDDNLALLLSIDKLNDDHLAKLMSITWTVDDIWPHFCLWGNLMTSIWPYLCLCPSLKLWMTIGHPFVF